MCVIFTCKIKPSFLFALDPFLLDGWFTSLADVCWCCRPHHKMVPDKKVLVG